MVKNKPHPHPFPKIGKGVLALVTKGISCLGKQFFVLQGKKFPALIDLKGFPYNFSGRRFLKLIPENN
jgi:hypothetical protein